MADKSLTLTQWYYVRGTMDGDFDAANFKPADGEVVPAGAEVRPVRGDGANGDACVGAWVRVSSFNGGGSATDLPEQTPACARLFNVVDSFDTHANIPTHFAAVDAALTRELEALDKLGGKALAQQRYQMFRAMGQNLPPAGEEVL